MSVSSLRVVDRIVAGGILLTVGAALVGLSMNRETVRTPAFSAGRWTLEGLIDHPEVLVNIALAVLFFGAGLLFTRRAETGGEELMTWLAAGCIVAGFARFNYFFYPTLYSDWISTGDILRVSSYVLLFVGIAREISRYQERAAESAVLDERRRLARDLHDGLSQELAYIAAEAQRLTSLTAEYADDRARLEHLASAARRALGESRRAIEALTQPVREPLHIVLAREAEEIADRIGVGLDLSIDPTIEVDPVTRETLVRILREAVTNASRHGNPHRISVELSNGDGIHLRVVDDGDGFEPDSPSQNGFGLVSMEERAKALGGLFRLQSQPGNGTEIEVVLP